MKFLDLLGTTLNGIRLGITGVFLKNSSGNLAVRNNADSADAELTASRLNVSGNDVVINSDAAESGADWKITLARPSSGMTANVVLTLPVDDGSPSQVLTTDGSGGLSWESAGTTASSLKLDSTSIAFGASSPVTMFTTGAGDIIDHIDIIVDTPFDGTPTLSVGISGTTSKYFPSTQLDLTEAAATTFTVHPSLGAQGAEALIATYSAGGATAGAARVIVHYATPS